MINLYDTTKLMIIHIADVGRLYVKSKGKRKEIVSVKKDNRLVGGIYCYIFGTS